jgi:hypothetical protein
MPSFSNTNIIVDLDRAILTTADAALPSSSWYWPRQSDLGMKPNK